MRAWSAQDIAASAGATLVVPAEDLRHSPRDLLDWLAREHITLCFAPTPLSLQKSRQYFAAVPWRSSMTTGAFVR